MNIRKIKKNQGVCAVIDSPMPVITDPQTALDVLMDAKMTAGTKNLVIHRNLVCPDFFVLGTGLAGEILQKYINYGARIAFIGDFTHEASKPLRDFIYESNRGHDVFFVATQEEAIERLTQ